MDNIARLGRQWESRGEVEEFLAKPVKGIQQPPDAVQLRNQGAQLCPEAAGTHCLAGLSNSPGASAAA